MSDGTSREMDLDEWVRVLPKHHLARGEYDTLRAALAEAQAERDAAYRRGVEDAAIAADAACGDDADPVVRIRALLPTAPDAGQAEGDAGEGENDG